MGNTCFLASSLQCLLSTFALVEFFGRREWEKEINRKSRTKGNLARAFGELAQRIASAPDYSVERPSALRSAVVMIAPQFGNFGQHDSQEFLRFLLSGLHDDLNRIVTAPSYVEIKDAESDDDDARSARWWNNYKERNDSIVTDVFAGQLRSTVVCASCSHVSTVFDPFLDLSLPIPKRSGTCSLTECFAEFTAEEKLDGNEKVYCSRCKKHRAATKRLSLYRFPSVLVVHLKRFSFRTFSRSKITTDVDFPLRLDLSAHVPPRSKLRAQTPIYDLFAVSNHSGSVSGGHYTANAKCSTEDAAPWYTFNDSSVYAASAASIKGPSAYVLFYRLRS
jgi:ubiquitin C-terminal hydrolase